MCCSKQWVKFSTRFDPTNGNYSNYSNNIIIIFECLDNGRGQVCGYYRGLPAPFRESENRGTFSAHRELRFGQFAPSRGLRCLRTREDFARKNIMSIAHLSGFPVTEIMANRCAMHSY